MEKDVKAEISFLKKRISEIFSYCGDLENGYEDLSRKLGELKDRLEAFENDYQNNITRIAE